MEMILSPDGSINCDIIDEYNPSVQSINFNLCATVSNQRGDKQTSCQMLKWNPLLVQ